MILGVSLMNYTFKHWKRIYFDNAQMQI